MKFPCKTKLNCITYVGINNELLLFHHLILYKSKLENNLMFFSQNYFHRMMSKPYKWVRRGYMMYFFFFESSSSLKWRIWQGYLPISSCSLSFIVDFSQENTFYSIFHNQLKLIYCHSILMTLGVYRRLFDFKSHFFMNLELLKNFFFQILIKLWGQGLEV
jgi:hypothetical protein